MLQARCPSGTNCTWEEWCKAAGGQCSYSISCRSPFCCCTALRKAATCPPGTICMERTLCEMKGWQCIAESEECEKDQCCCGYDEEVIEEFEEKFEKGTYTPEAAESMDYARGMYVSVNRDPEKAAFVWSTFFRAYGLQLGMEDAEAKAFSDWRTFAMLIAVDELKSAREWLRTVGAEQIIAGMLTDYRYTPGRFAADAVEVVSPLWGDVRRASNWYISLSPANLGRLMDTLARMWEGDPEEVAKALIDMAKEIGASPRAIYNNMYFIAYRAYPYEWVKNVARALDRLSRRMR
ncbi:MAG: hypothetical protein ACP5I3_10580 [Thermoproteus sp.]